MNQVEQDRKMAQIVARCWSDEDFKQKLLADATSALKAAGIELPPGKSIKAVENTDAVAYLFIPPKPTDLSDATLDRVVGGMISEKEYSQHTEKATLLDLLCGFNTGCRNVRW
jgi:hypothetical protein